MARQAGEVGHSLQQSAHITRAEQNQLLAATWRVLLVHKIPLQWEQMLEIGLVLLGVNQKQPVPVRWTKLRGVEKLTLCMHSRFALFCVGAIFSILAVVVGMTYHYTFKLATISTFSEPDYTNW